MFFCLKSEEIFRKMFCSLNKDFVQNVPMYILIVNWTPLLKIFSPRFRISQKSKEKFKIRMTFLTQIFHLVYYKLAVERKRKKIPLEHLRKCEKMHFKIIYVDRIALKRFFITFFCLCQSLREGTFPLSKTIKFEELSFYEKIRSSIPETSSSTEFDGSKKTAVAGYLFCFCSHVRNALQKSSAKKLHFLPKDW